MIHVSESLPGLRREQPLATAMPTMEEEEEEEEGVIRLRKMSSCLRPTWERMRRRKMRRRSAVKVNMVREGGGGRPSAVRVNMVREGGGGGGGEGEGGLGEGGENRYIFFLCRDGY